MRYAIVTETYPPEVNGVALTVHGLEHGLRARGHEVSVIRPRQDKDGHENGDAGTLLVLGAGRNTLRLSPPLVLTKAQADTAVRIIDESLAAMR